MILITPRVRYGDVFSLATWPNQVLFGDGQRTLLILLCRRLKRTGKIVYIVSRGSAGRLFRRKNAEGWCNNFVPHQLGGTFFFFFTEEKKSSLGGQNRVFYFFSGNPRFIVQFFWPLHKSTKIQEGRGVVRDIFLLSRKKWQRTSPVLHITSCQEQVSN